MLKLQVRTWALSGQWGPAVHPSRREKVKSKRVPRCPVATGHADLEAELEGIQQQLQHYQSTKQNLRCGPEAPATAAVGSCLEAVLPSRVLGCLQSAEGPRLHSAASSSAI